MKQSHFRIATLVLALFFATSLLTAQAEPGSGGRKNKAKTNHRDKKPNAEKKEKKNLLEVNLNHSDGIYTQGDEVLLEITAKRPGYIYALYHDVAGNVINIYPNQFEKETRIEKKQPILIPGPDSPFTLRVQPPFGKEKIVVMLIADKLLTKEDLEAKLEAGESLPAILDVVTIPIETFPRPATENRPEIILIEGDVEEGEMEQLSQLITSLTTENEENNIGDDETGTDEICDVHTCFSIKELKNIFGNDPHTIKMVLIMESADKQLSAFIKIQSKKPAEE